MAKIDDPLGQAEEQHRHRPSQGLARLLNLAAPVMSLLDPESGALATMMGFLTTAMGQEQSESQAEVFRAAFIGEIRSLEGRVEVIERVTAGPDAQDAFAQAMRAALGTARQDKARVFGRLLGVTVKQESPNWQEAAEFIRTIEEFGDLDISALKIFWRVQSTAYRVKTAAGTEMSTDANDFTAQWSGVLDRATKAGFSKDEWSSGCARLGGFGLTAMVRENRAYQGNDAMCYRLTGRGVRLLKVLGMNVDPGAYPAVFYNAAGQTVTVNDEDERDALGDGWADTPAAFAKK